MSKIKSGVLLAICAVLIIAAALSGRASAPLAGPGNATDKRVTDMQELSSLMSAVTDDRSDALSVTAKEESSVESYTSFTLTETSSGYINSEVYESSRYDNNSGSSSTSTSNMSFNRVLDIYKTAEGILYTSVGRINSKTERQSKSYGTSNRGSTSKTRTSTDFEVQIYYGNDRILIRIDKFNYTYDYEYTDLYNSDNNKHETEADQRENVLKNYYNMWIDCTSEPSIAQMFLRINNSNLQTIASFATLFKQACSDSKDKIFRESNGVYILKKEAYIEFLNVGQKQAEALEGDLIVDLTNQKKPSFGYNYVFNYKDSWDNEFYGSTSSQTDDRFCGISDEFRFKNINNTVIKKMDFDTIDIEDIIIEEED